MPRAPNRTIITAMATGHLQPWWEQPAKSPADAGFEAKREHLRAELARAWRAARLERQRPDAQTVGRPPYSPSAV